jgi:hypothetical protein
MLSLNFTGILYKKKKRIELEIAFMALSMSDRVRLNFNLKLKIARFLFKGIERYEDVNIQVPESSRESLRWSKLSMETRVDPAAKDNSQIFSAVD